MCLEHFALSQLEPDVQPSGSSEGMEHLHAGPDVAR
jgi:hypothetical protein